MYVRYIMYVSFPLVPLVPYIAYYIISVTIPCYIVPPDPF